MSRISKVSKNTLFVFGLLSILFYSFKSIDTNDTVRKQLELFTSVYRTVLTHYVDTINAERLISTATVAITKTLDPYTEYIPESELADFKSNYLTRDYAGIGVRVFSKGNQILVESVYEGYPAQQAGLQIGDEIIGIDNHIITGTEQSDISDILRGAKNTTVVVTIQREGASEPIIKKITRKEISLPSISYSGIYKNNIGYIKLDQFMDGSAVEVKNTFIALNKKSKLTGVILDLRDNGGGLLNEAITIVSYFVPKGSPIVAQQERKDTQRKIQYAHIVPLDTLIPIIVLINENSASASEIVAGAFQDLDRGVVIGQQSFGKGLVQQTSELPYNGLLKITVAKYYTPSGRCIQRLNYTHNEDKMKVFTGSDTAMFNTLNGRLVKSGTGITPDIYISESYLSPFVVALHDSLLFFSYANKYKQKHTKIASAKDFKLKPEEYKEFIEFAHNRDFKYKSQSNKILEKLDNNNLKDIPKENLTILTQKVDEFQINGFTNYSTDISLLLEAEIISRYYYRKGETEHLLKHDPVLNESLKVINNKNSYTNILNGVGDYKFIGQNSVEQRQLD